MSEGENQKRSNRKQGRLRIILFHLVTLCIILFLFGLLELVLRLCTPAPAVDLYDPYISFSGLRPLFVLDSTKTHFETSEERLAAFYPQSFTATKSPETFRIFCLGGSTVQGRPYAVETSFTTWLELNLRASRPGVKYEVVNCGGVSYASYRLVPIMKELLEHEPDLFIICTGHNEFIEDRTYRHLKKTPHALMRLHWTMLKLRSYSLAEQFFSRRHRWRTDNKNSQRTVLSPEVRTKLDLREGLDSYHRDELWRQGIIEHFRYNLETMVRMSRGAGVPVILVNPVSNLKDCAPFKSEFSTDLSESQIQRVVELWEQAGKLDWGDTYGKISLIEQAVAIESRHADLLYLLGKCYEHIGRFAEARKWFVMAKEQDVCPLRILEPMHEAIRNISSEFHVPLVDVKNLIEEHTEDGIPGEEWLLDHAHPSISGHQLIADSLYQTMEEMRLVSTPEGWLAIRDELRERHISSLNTAYYEHGITRLQRLNQWSRGRIPHSPSSIPDSKKD